MRCRSAERRSDGYLLVPPIGLHLTGGPACITAHWHPPDMSQQENVVLLGTAEPTDDGRIHVRVTRALMDWSLTGSRLGRTLSFVANGRTLRPRLQQEAMRRGQSPPAVNLPSS
jgi:hypothetical protein